MSVKENNTSIHNDIASRRSRGVNTALPEKGMKDEGRAPAAMLTLEDATASTARETGMSTQRKYVVMLAMCLGMFVTQLDVYIMTTTLPKITSELGASDSSYAWTASAYLLACASFIPIWASFSEIVGRKIVLEIISGLFMLGTLLGAMAGTPTVLIISRTVQGCASGGIFVVIFIYIAETYPPRERALYFGLVGAVAAIASPIGPFIGGALTDKLSWRWCFWITLPVTSISFFMIMLYLKNDVPQKGVFESLRSVDWYGGITIVCSTVMILLGLQYGVSNYSWRSPRVISFLTIGSTVLLAFAFIEMKIAKKPLMPPRFFNNLPRISVLTVCFTSALVQGGTIYFIPMYFQVVLGASPFKSGLYFLPTVLTLALLWTTAGHVIHRTGRYVLIIRIAMAFVLLGTGLLIDTQPYLSWPRIITSQIVVALGLGLTFQAPLMAFHGVIDAADTPMGTSTYQFLKTFAQTVSVVLGQVIFQSQVKKNIHLLIEAKLPQIIISGIARAESIGPSLQDLQLEEGKLVVLRGVFVQAVRMMWIFYTTVSLLGFVASFGIPGKVLSDAQPREEDKQKELKEDS
jgi:MFS family permease